MIKGYKILVFASLLLSMFACKKAEETAGLVLQPEDNRLKVYQFNINSFNTLTEIDQIISTGISTDNNMVGSIYDDVFGRTTAGFVSQILLSTDNVEFNDDRQIISTELHLYVSGYEGDSNATTVFKIYESNFEIDANTTYPSSQDIGILGDLVADFSFDARNYFDYADTSNYFIIPFSNDFGQKILNTNSIYLEDNTVFTNAYKGLYFSIDTALSGNLIWKFNFNKITSYIEIKYSYLESEAATVRDTNTFKLNLSSSAGRFNLYQFNRSPLQSIIGLNSNECYVAGMGNVKSKIDLSPVLTFRDSGELMIYKAELVAHAKASTSPYAYKQPTGLLLSVDLGNDDTTRYVDDLSSLSYSNFDGSYNDEDSTYRMVITRHIQNLINNNHQDTLLWISPYGKNTSTARTTLDNGHDGNPITLRITYTKLH
ncbi:MAG: DUF4270 family protein [Bacteroidales bacterium]|nr:DUF4270 family protein [Bacteroidales bacterium]